MYSRVIACEVAGGDVTELRYPVEDVLEGRFLRCSRRRRNRLEIAHGGYIYLKVVTDDVAGGSVTDSR